MDAAVDGYVDAAIRESLTGVGSCLYAHAVVTGAKPQLPAVVASGLPVDPDQAKEMAKNWAALPEDAWVDAYKSDLSAHLQTAVLRCPRTLNQCLELLAEKFEGTGMEAKLIEVREVFAHIVSIVNR